MKTIRHLSLLFILTIFSACSNGKTTQPPIVTIWTPTFPAPVLLSTPVVQPINTLAITTPSASPLPETAVSQPVVPYDMISLDRLFGFLTDLTSIQPYSGWRSAGSSGEVEAFDYVADQLAGYTNLLNLGMTVERQSFPVFMTVEFWESRLVLTVEGIEIEVPASGLRGSRYNTQLARNFDSDGGLNDSERDPITASGSVLVVETLEQLDELHEEDVRGQVIFVDFSLIDYYISEDAFDIGGKLVEVMAWEPAGLVLVTQNNNRLGKSHGTGVGDGSVFQRLDFQPKIPILYVRMEDLAPAGIKGWEDLTKIEAAQLTWDADVFSPGQSGNLIARIPGADSSQAVILGAHIDSPNSPGAIDNGAGVATLLEIARVLDETSLLPAVDLYLAWFGSHEIGIYGSAFFVSTHQELLDQTIAMLQMDCLGFPMTGSHPQILAETWSYGQFGDVRLTWLDYLNQAIQPQNIELQTENAYALLSDNSNFNAFNVPNLNLEYFDFGLMNQGRFDVHYLNYLHDPYETVELARQVGDALQGMAKTALAAAVQTGRDRPALRVAPAPSKRALYVASHTETPDMAPPTLLELGMALAWEGFDVDLIPYGQSLIASDLAEAGFVLLLPTLDYAGSAHTEWSEAEIDLLEQYVKEGGFLVITNSYYNIAMNRTLSETNEDSRQINRLTERLGIRFKVGVLNANLVKSSSEHALMSEAEYLNMWAENGVPFEIETGEVLATAEGRPIIALVDHGLGQVLVVGDIGLLMDYGGDAKNLQFLKNIAQFVSGK